MSKDAVPLCAHPSVYKGSRWVAKINGRSSMNGERYGITLHGEITEVPDGLSLYDAVRDLIDHCEAESGSMQFPDSIQITILPPQTTL